MIALNEEAHLTQAEQPFWRYGAWLEIETPALADTRYRILLVSAVFALCVVVDMGIVAIAVLIPQVSFEGNIMLIGRTSPPSSLPLLQQHHRCTTTRSRL